MTLQQSLRAVAVTLLIAIFAGGGSSAYAQVASNVPAGIQLSKDLGLADPAAEINITVHLKLNDKAAFDKAVNALYDHASPTFHKWMTNADLKKYAPTQAQQQIVRQELQNHGLTILSTDAAGFTIRATAPSLTSRAPSILRFTSSSTTEGPSAPTSRTPSLAVRRGAMSRP